MHIQLEITRERHGQTITTYASLTEDGWHQWGGGTAELGETVSLLDALQSAASEEGAFNEPEEDEEEQENEDEDA